MKALLGYGGIRKQLGELHPQAEIRLLRLLIPKGKMDIDLLLGVGGVDGECIYSLKRMPCHG